MIKKENSNEFMRNSDIHGKISDILENKQGIYRMSIELESQNENIAKNWFVEFCKKIGTPLSQNENGEILLSVRDQSLGEKDPRTRGPNTNKNSVFIQTVVM